MQQYRCQLSVMSWVMPLPMLLLLVVVLEQKLLWYQAQLVQTLARVVR